MLRLAAALALATVAPAQTYKVLKSFSGGSDGQLPNGGLVLAGSTLYGTTSGGGYSDCGVVFKINTDGSGYTVLKSFSGGGGREPEADLVLGGGTLYGTTSRGGSSGYGVVFALDWVGPTAPPTIVLGPQSQTIEPGGSIAFTIRVANTGPLAYQWVFNGTNALAGATNSVLQMTNLHPAQSGAYAVILTNDYGAVTSAPAILEVIPPGTVPVTSCTQGALRLALAGPGPVTFACDGTITVTDTLTISSNIVLDGTGHQITISGDDAVQVFRVNSDVTFSALNLTIANGLSTNGGAIYNDGGTVNLTNCTLAGSRACGSDQPASSAAIGADGCGGAIYNAGNLNVSLCAFWHNLASGGSGSTAANDYQDCRAGAGLTGGSGQGGAIWSRGTLLVDRSLFLSNAVVGGAGGRGDDGFPRDNTLMWACPGGPGGDGGDGSGGAIGNSGALAVERSLFANNTARGGDGGGGGGGFSAGHAGGVNGLACSAGGDGGSGGWSPGGRGFQPRHWVGCQLHLRRKRRRRGGRRSGRCGRQCL
jgi:uncharacterized repeat protein (TIGR03803 family)